MMTIQPHDVPRMPSWADALRQAALSAQRIYSEPIERKSLTDTQVVTCRRLYASGSTARALATQFGVSEQTIERAVQ